MKRILITASLISVGLAIILLRSADEPTLGNQTVIENAIAQITSKQNLEAKFVQVLENNQRPSDSNKSLGIVLPSNVSIDVLTAPEGDYYVVKVRDADRITSYKFNRQGLVSTRVDMIDPLNPPNTP